MNKWKCYSTVSYFNSDDLPLRLIITPVFSRDKPFDPDRELAMIHASLICGGSTVIYAPTRRRGVKDTPVPVQEYLNSHHMDYRCQNFECKIYISHYFLTVTLEGWHRLTIETPEQYKLEIVPSVIDYVREHNSQRKEP